MNYGNAARWHPKYNSNETKKVYVLIVNPSGKGIVMPKM